MRKILIAILLGILSVSAYADKHIMVRGNIYFKNRMREFRDFTYMLNPKTAVGVSCTNMLYELVAIRQIHIGHKYEKYWGMYEPSTGIIYVRIHDIPYLEIMRTTYHEATHRYLHCVRKTNRQAYDKILEPFGGDEEKLCDYQEELWERAWYKH